MGRKLIDEDLDDMVSRQAGEILLGLDDETVNRATEVVSVLSEREAAAIRKVGKVKAIVNRQIKKYPGMRHYEDRTYTMYFVRYPNAEPVDLWNEMKEAYGKQH